MRRSLRAATALAAFASVVLAAESSAWARGCTEVSDIVGYEKCHRFGDGWAVERRLPIAIALTLPYETFDPNGIDFDFSTKKNDPNAFTVPGSKLGSNGLGALGLHLRIEGFVWGWLYTGIDWGLGLGHNALDDFTSPVKGVPTRFIGSEAAVNTTMMNAGAFLGLRVPLGRLSLRLEGFAGGTSTTVDVSAPTAGNYTASAGRWELMPRGIFDVWASPNVTMSVFGGFNALDTRERTAGVMIEYHMRSFDGAFSFW